MRSLTFKFSHSLRAIASVFLSLCALYTASLVLHSCNATVIDGATLPAQEQIVVSGILVAGQAVRNIEITRTIPPLDTFRVSKTLINDAQVTITVDGRTIPLTLQTPTGRVPLDSSGRPIAGFDVEASKYEAPTLIPEGGKTYTLTINWNGKRATATTLVPLPPDVRAFDPLVWRLDSVTRIVGGMPGMGGGVMPPMGGGMPGPPVTARIQELSTKINLTLQPRENEGYRYTRIGFRDTVRAITLPDALITNATLRLPLSIIEALPLTYSAQFQITANAPFRLQTANTVSVVSVEAMDAAFERYQTSANRNSATSSPLGGNGQNPIWNVSGDGIGIFVGRSLPKVVTLRPK
jgi:Domain of unknown function (DUF4249)